MAETLLFHFSDSSIKPHYFYSSEGKDFFIVSPDSKRMAFLLRQWGGWRRSKQFVLVDGEAQKPYDAISVSTLQFSPNSRRLAYASRSKKKSFVVVDGEEEGPYDNVTAIRFSPNGQRVAWIIEEHGWLVSRQTINVDGQRQETYHGIAPESLAFSPDSRHLAYGAWKDKAWRVVVDGKDGGLYENVTNVVFAPRGERVAYIAGKGDESIVVTDGKESRPYVGIGGLLFSPDGKRQAYGAQSGDTWSVVADGEEGDGFESLGEGSLLFSPDSRHLSYVASQDGRQFVVTDGKRQKAYGSILGEPRPTYSPDSRHFAYVAFQDGCTFVVRDGEEQKTHEDVLAKPFVFSPDNRRLAYAIRVGDEEAIVLDGEPLKSYSKVSSPVFSPNGVNLVYAATRSKMVDVPEHVANLAKVSDNKVFVVVDGKEGHPYDDIIMRRGGRIVLDSDQKFHFLAVRGGSLAEGVPIPVVEGSRFLLVDETVMAAGPPPNGSSTRKRR